MKLADPYIIVVPEYGLKQLYVFESDSGIQYEVRFGRMQSNPFHSTVVFGVTNEEFDGEEYVETKKGEQYRVISTIVEIVKLYLFYKPNTRLLEFTGVVRKNHEGISEPGNTRVRFFTRYAKAVFDDSWQLTINDDKVVITKLKS